MEKHTIKNDINVFGGQVTSFPNGIGEAFEPLMKKIPDGFNRSYYGIAKMEGNQIIYIAAAEEKSKGEGKKYQCNDYVIEGGEYLTIAIADWQPKTDSIKDVFGELMKDNRTDKSKPCIEWYKNDKEMFCMMKVRPGNS